MSSVRFLDSPFCYDFAGLIKPGGFLPGVANMHDEVHHLVNGDGAILVGVGQPEDGGRHASIAEDFVEGGRVDGVILTDEIGDGLEQLHDIDAVFAVAAGKK